MARQSFMGDEPWDDVREERKVRTRLFARTADQLLTGSLMELGPGSPGHHLHMHYGLEEMFFVVSGTPTLRTGDGEEVLAPGDVVHCSEGRPGLHTFTNATDEPVRILAVSAGHMPDIVAYPELGYGWVGTHEPEDMPADGDGIIVRFELPPESPGR